MNRPATQIATPSEDVKKCMVRSFSAGNQTALPLTSKNATIVRKLCPFFQLLAKFDA